MHADNIINHNNLSIIVVNEKIIKKVNAYYWH